MKTTRRVHRALPTLPTDATDEEKYTRVVLRRHRGGRPRDRLTVHRRIELAAARGSGSVLSVADVGELWALLNGKCGMLCERERERAHEIVRQVAVMVQEVDEVLGRTKGVW